jgi:hypothetical protein
MDAISPAESVYRWILARPRDYLTVARAAMECSCSRRCSDGSSWYTEVPKYQRAHRRA